MTALTSWLTSTLPPEAGPPLQWAAANIGVITPALVLLFALALFGVIRLVELVA